MSPRLLKLKYVKKISFRIDFCGDCGYERVHVVAKKNRSEQ